MLKPINSIIKDSIGNIIYRGNVVTGTVATDNGDGSYDVFISESDRAYPKIFTLSRNPDLAIGDKVRILYKNGCKELPIILPPVKPPVLEGWNLLTATYDKSYYVGSQDKSPFAIYFKSDGSKMYVAGDVNNTVYQYTLSTPWDVSTATYEKSCSIATQDSYPHGVYFKSDGSKMYVAGQSNDTIYQYTLSTPWDISTASYESKFYSISAQDTNPYAIYFKSDGNKMYMLGQSNKTIYQYTLSTPWDISTASYDSKSKDVSSEDSLPHGIYFKSDGSKMYLTGDSNDKVYQYTLSTPWDISTASYDSIYKDVSSEDSYPYEVYFKPDGFKMYLTGQSNDKVYQYTIGS